MKNKSVVLVVIALVVVVGVVAAIALTGNKSDTSTSSNDSMSGMNMNSDSASSSKSDAVATDTVKISNYAFSPQVIKVKVGDKVTWTNEDSVKHSVVADTESADAPKSELLAQGETYSFTFTKAGTYTYHCEPHPYMKATVIVE